MGPDRNGHDTGLPLPSILEPHSPGTGAVANVGESGAVPGPFVSEHQQRRQIAGSVSHMRVDLERHRDFPVLGGPETGHKLI